MPLLLWLFVLALPANAAGLLFYQSPGNPNPYNLSGSGLIDVTISGSSGTGYAYPILDADADWYPGGYASSSISIGNISWMNCTKGLVCTNLSGAYPDIAFQFNQDFILPFSYQLTGSGYGPSGYVEFDGFVVYDSQGNKIGTNLGRLNGFVTPEPSTWLLALAGLATAAALRRPRVLRRRAICALALLLFLIVPAKADYIISPPYNNLGRRFQGCDSST